MVVFTLHMVAPVVLLAGAAAQEPIAPQALRPDGSPNRAVWMAEGDFGELEGIAHRGDFDLRSHSEGKLVARDGKLVVETGPDGKPKWKGSGKDLSYFDDERKETAAAFWARCAAFFTAAGARPKRVLTDNGACYRSTPFADALTATTTTHKRTRPYRPQTNGKVERYNRTMLEEWAYAAAYVSGSDRAARLPAFLHHYNFHRGHTALRGASPADRVHNLRGQYT